MLGVSALALAAHIAGDVITSFGTMIFAPLSDWRAAIGTTFIIDPWFTGILVAGLLASAFFYRSRWPAVAASALVAGYVGFQYVQKEKALDIGAQYVLEHGLSGAKVSVQPRPVSPFNWTVFVSDEQAHRYAHVNLVRSEARSYGPGDGFIAKIDSPYRPVAQAFWVRSTRFGQPPLDALARDAWQSPALAFFRWFADVPAFDGVTEGSTCVGFVDLRFLTPGRDVMPFRFAACRDAPCAPWRLSSSP
ncbi:MAG: metal-dependent hydrolase [Betaproteobacteria bacterium]|nr:MAG: metal-dependent hydrolase [Betaproteobacteria bacterium]